MSVLHVIGALGWVLEVGVLLALALSRLVALGDAAGGDEIAGNAAG